MHNRMDFLMTWFGECAFEESITFSTITKELQTIYPQIAKYDLPQIVCMIYPPLKSSNFEPNFKRTQHHALLHKGLFCERPINECFQSGFQHVNFTFKTNSVNYLSQASLLKTNVQRLVYLRIRFNCRMKIKCRILKIDTTRAWRCEILWKGHLTVSHSQHPFRHRNNNYT